MSLPSFSPRLLTAPSTARLFAHLWSLELGGTQADSQPPHLTDVLRVSVSVAGWWQEPWNHQAASPVERMRHREEKGRLRWSGKAGQLEPTVGSEGESEVEVALRTLIWATLMGTGFHGLPKVLPVCPCLWQTLHFQNHDILRCWGLGIPEVTSSGPARALPSTGE